MWKLHEQNPDMTAVFISNYEMTVGAMMEINDLGIRCRTSCLSSDLTTWTLPGRRFRS